MKKICILLICISIILTTAFSSAFFCNAEENLSTAFEEIIAGLKSEYESNPDSIVNTSYYALLNKGENLLTENEETQTISHDRILEFNRYRLYYYRAKAENQIRSSFKQDSFSIVFDQKTFYFYEFQWSEAEKIYKSFLNKILTAEEYDSFDSILADYYLSINSLEDKTSIDERISEYIKTSLNVVDKAIVQKINLALEENKLNTIDENDIPSYSLNTNNDSYNKWLSHVLSLAYAQENISKITKIHSRLEEELKGLPLETTRDVYTQKANEAITEITIIENNCRTQTEYLLKSKKESAILQIEFFMQGKSYTEAKKNVQKEMENITTKALSQINEATSIEEIDYILDETLNALAEVEVGGKDWITMLVIGVVLAVALIFVIVLFAIKKKKNLKKSKKDNTDFETANNDNE